MLAYEVKSYYDGVYMGEPIADEDFPRLQARAEDALMAATFGRLHGCYPPSVNDAILRAWCAQIEWLHFNGIEAALGSDGGSGFVVGHVTVYGTSAKNNNGTTGGLCQRAVQMLAPTGLMCCAGVLV